MENYLFHIFIPMILSNVIHIVMVKKRICASLAIPIARTWFGENKTWRGMIILPLLNGVLFWIVNMVMPLFGQIQALFYGGILGLTYMIFELPNSWFKRKMGIGAGQKAEKNAWSFMLLDKMDSAIGVSLASKIIFDLTWMEALKLFGLAVLIHVFFSWLLVTTGVKKRF